MIGAHYPLQALLYAVAVHRLLRWRQPGYDPDRHLGGVLYLFVRGMAGAETPGRRPGALWGVQLAPAGGLVAELSDLLDGDPTMTAVATAAAVGDERGRLVHDRQGLLGNVQRGRGSGRRGRAHRAAVGRIGGRTRPVLLALALAVRALRNGSVALDLQTWTRRCSTRPRRRSTCRAALAGADGVGGRVSGSPLVAVGAEAAAAVPLRMTAACSTWSGTGSRRSWSVGLQHRLAADPPAIDPRGWPRAWTGCSRDAGDG